MIFGPNDPLVRFGFDPTSYLALPKNAPLGIRVARDIDQILGYGYAEDISAHDFFHGHILGEKGERCSLESALIVSHLGILYHTRERMGYEDLQRLDSSTRCWEKVSENAEKRKTGIADGTQFWELFIESLNDPLLQRNILSDKGKIRFIFPRSVDLTEPVGERVCTVYDSDLNKQYIAAVFFKVSKNGNYRLDNGTFVDVFMHIEGM